jgi:DNA-3-methyladenine glycosylase
LPKTAVTRANPASPKHPQAAAKLLSRRFYLDPAQQVARRLLGKLLFRTMEAETLVGRIVEVEAYIGEQDAAAHSFGGRTARNEVLFGPPGHAYVYFIYGMYYCLNFSCEPAGQAGSVLIRALEPVAGLETMARLRGLPEIAQPRLLASGPGRLCQAFAIRRGEHNGVDLTKATSKLQVRDDGFLPDDIVASPRIGIRKAVDLSLRFSIAGNPFVSRPWPATLK